MNTWAQIIVLVVSTFASEDLTCIGAGQLVGRGEMDWFVATFSCFVGIFLGDLGLWLIGRSLGRRALELAWVRKRIAADKFERLENWFDRNAGTAILSARFVPGLRLPMFLAAGAIGRRADRFVWWAFWAALLWTPLLVLGVALLGDTILRPLKQCLGAGWPALAAAIMLWYVILRSAAAMLTPVGRARVMARIGKLWRWEFWPMALFYPPVLLWILYLAIRYRGFSTITAANPGIPHSGFVGESKFDIIRSLRSPHVVPTERILPGAVVERARSFREILLRHNWTFPVILKPDAGQRGAGVKLVQSGEDAMAYLTHTSVAVLVQPFHPGPFEAGVFYFRHPHEEFGRVFSITDKQFPDLVGDGRSTLEELIWLHPRFRFQARAFLKRHAYQAQRVLAEGERFRLAVAGNHCQGTMFRDGAHLITQALERKIDQIAKTFPGFYFGRFDVRYSDPEQFKAGKDLAIIELNGATSESTNIYDPSWSLVRAYRTIFQQWHILFRIGAANRSRGESPSRLSELLRDAFSYLRTRRITTLAD